MKRWTVAQLGAREHYAVARALHRRGELNALFTDAYCARGRGLLRRGPAAARALAARHHPDLPSSAVVAFTAHALFDRLLSSARRGRRQEYEGYAAEGSRFAVRVAQALRGARLDSTLDVFFGYATGCLEVVRELALLGVPTIVDQIDPGPVEERLVVEERARWPGWEGDVARVPDVYWDRLRAEWSSATRVVVNSEWSRDALVAEGVPAEKLRVVPLAFEVPVPALHSKPARAPGPLRVLWLGSVGLRKGIQYLFEAAHRVIDRDMRFLIAGPLQIAPEVVARAPRNVQVVGRVTRDRASALYREADVFVLPTISDGFAITQLEALAHGVPVIVTPNCASVVTPDVDGVVVPARDSEALAAALCALDDDRDRLARLTAAAPAKAASYSLERLGKALSSLLDPEPVTAP
jgi:glycosyltransferase involved in cell wall biosynthesis